MQHFGLYFDDCKKTGWGKNPEDIQKILDQKADTASFLKEVIQLRAPGFQNDKNRSNPFNHNCCRCRLSLEAAAGGPGTGTLRTENSHQCKRHCGFGESR